jgi:hypothetical protein
MAAAAIYAILPRRKRELAAATLVREERPFMPTSCTPAVERIARVLAGRQLSLNGEGKDPHASGAVDAAWRDHIEDAYAILNTLREPDAQMAQAGDVAVWRSMIGAVLGSRAGA